MSDAANWETMATLTNRPEYFEQERKKAAQRWDKNKDDSENTRVWFGYFESVQYPRHVVSELLQNADDAGATMAIMAIKEQTISGHRKRQAATLGWMCGRPDASC